MKKYIALVFLLLFAFIPFTHLQVFALEEDEFIMRDIDRGTFNEYRFRLARKFFELKWSFEVNYTISPRIAQDILDIAKTAVNYLPESLKNENYFNDLKIAIEQGIKEPQSGARYDNILDKLSKFIWEIQISKLQWSIEVTPRSGNAPLNATFRGRVTDPSGSEIPSANYVWWFDIWWKKKVIGRWNTLNYTFLEEWIYTVFLDATSNHKNSKGYTDVLPFSSRQVVEVKEKIASVIVNINWIRLWSANDIKFTPDESVYGLVIDATNTTPNGGARFLTTEWDFWNGVLRKYDGWPKIERAVYSKEWTYNVVLKLTTNESKVVERKFLIDIRKPIATIQTSKDDGYIGDKFTFSARTSANEANLTYTWRVIDISQDKVILTKNGNTFTHIFTDKWRYNVQLQTKNVAWEEDSDTKIVYINSREPVADFTTSIPDNSKPNRVFIDGSKSYDLDFTDMWKLKYQWTIDGERVELDYVDEKWAIGYYTFTSIGNHEIWLDVIDTDDLQGVIKKSIQINSILSVDFNSLPKIAQIGKTVRFSADASQARYFEWDFWDGNSETSTSRTIQHSFQKSGIYNVRLTVRDRDGKTNSTTKVVYISPANSTYAMIGLNIGASQIPIYDENACGEWAYIVDRVNSVQFKWWESINLDGSNTGLSYTWKIGYDKFITTQDTSYRFDDLWCYPVKLSVRSNKNGASHSMETWVKVENLKPVFSSLNVSAQDTNADPVVVSVSAVWAQDPDGVIQSYLWYYYTDIDSDPQDFRMTTTPNTTFVIPNIRWEYNFVLVMKDNNDERTSSQDLGNKYNISLAGDNINTPLIDIKVNKNNLLIWEEAVFNVNVKNILWQDLTQKASYAWDFDGDGFYDEESSKWEISYQYKNSWTFYMKVKVKYKWITNTRSIEVNVSNILKPSFEATSLWDSVVIFNTSQGSFDKISWDMWDGNIVEGRSNFVYTYEDGQSSHTITLRIAEWTKVQTFNKTISKDVRTLLEIRKETGIYMKSFPQIINDEIILENYQDKIALYIHPKDTIGKYWVDFDIDMDSDLNGSKDDDIDNEKTSSYDFGGIIEIPINENKFQTIRVFLLDSWWNIVDARDIKVSKNYIEQRDDIDPNSINFDGVSDREREKVEKLKTFIQWLPQENRLMGMQYLQQLQDEWFYLSEKTRIILDFEAYIDSLNLSNGWEIINLLESFLVEWQEDQSVRSMAYNVVKNLLPSSFPQYQEMITSLDSIYEKPENIDENKVLGKNILEAIKDTSLILDDDKYTIRTQLLVLIYGSIENVPQESKPTLPTPPSSGSGLGLIKSLGNLIVWIGGWLIVLMIWIFIWYKISTKNENQWIQDFIIEKGSGWWGDDILGWEMKLQETSAKKQKNTASSSKESSESIPDWLQWGSAPLSDPLNESISRESDGWNKKWDELSITPTSQALGEVPDWLVGWPSLDTPSNDWDKDTFDIDPFPWEKKDDASLKDVSNKILEKPLDYVETKVEELAVPDWLKWAISNDSIESKAQEEIIPTSSSVTSQWSDIINDKERFASELKQDQDVFDFEDEIPSGKISSDPVQNDSNKTMKVAAKESLDQKDVVPDWLQWVLSQENILTPSSQEIESSKQNLDTLNQKSKKVSKDDTKVTKTPPSSSDILVDESSLLSQKEKQENQIPDWFKQPTEKKSSSKTTQKKKKSDDFWSLDEWD